MGGNKREKGRIFFYSAVPRKFIEFSGNSEKKIEDRSFLSDLQSFFPRIGRKGMKKTFGARRVFFTEPIYGSEKKNEGLLNKLRRPVANVQIRRIWTFGFAMNGSAKKSCLSFRFRKILFPLPRRGRGKKHANRKNDRPLRFLWYLRGPTMGGNAPLPSKIASDFRRQRSKKKKIQNLFS